jgi:coenzyme F420 hydrogenase subunit beta
VVVCTPCEILSARKIQQSVEGDCEVVIVGLFCFEAFKVAKLKQEAKTRLDVDLDKIEKTQIRKGKFTAVLDRKEISCRLKDLEEATEKACRYCDDFTSRLADVSVGSVGSKKGYSTVIVRSETGEKLVESLDCDKRAVDKEEIAKLSKFKRIRAQESFATLNNRQ